MMFMFGVRGVGKGLYGKKLARDLQLNYITIGGIIRKIIDGKIFSKHEKLL